jgi:DNA-binding response OmpR family regulator
MPREKGKKRKISAGVWRKGGTDVRILVVESDRIMNEAIKKRLEEEKYCVDSCYDGDTAIDYLRLAEYDGVLMDTVLPGKSGFKVLKELRKQDTQTPVMLLAEENNVEDTICGLDAGADDYMVKPFHFSEMMARVRALVRKRDGVRENTYRCGDLEININEQFARRGGKKIDLSPKEYALLLYMVRNQNIVLTREKLETNSSDFSNETFSNVVDVYIRYLRKKIDDGFEKKLIHTVRGVGYMLKYDED